MKFIVLITIVFQCMIFTCIADDDKVKTSVKEGLDSLIGVNAFVDNAKVTIGDKIEYKITIDSTKEIEVVFPEIKDKLGGLTVVDSGKEKLKENEGRVLQERSYTLETYTVGAYIIPAIEIKHKRKDEVEERTAKTPEIFVEVVSVLDENASDIRDIVPPVQLIKNYSKLYIIIAIAIGVLAIIGATIFYLYRRKHGKKEKIPDPLLPHEIAYNEFDHLKSLNLIETGQIKEFYYHLSIIVRHYIEDRFALMAPERTTEEFLAEMLSTDKLAEGHKKLIGDFLEHCDLVKFAGYGPGTSEIENAFGSAKRLVDETTGTLQGEVAVKEDKVLASSTN